MRKPLNFLLISALIFLSLGGSALMADAGVTPTAPAASSGIVNINTADVGQLSLLPRVGAKVAQRIVDYRKEHGAFKKTSDLLQVKGIGDKAFERLRVYLTVDGKTTLTEKISGPRKARGGSSSSSSKSSRKQPPATAAM